MLIRLTPREVFLVIPAKAGIHNLLKSLDPRLSAEGLIRPLADAGMTHGDRGETSG